MLSYEGSLRIYPIDDIRRWVEAGETCPMIGKRLGRTANAIQAVCKLHGIQLHPVGWRPTNRTWPVEQIRQWVEVEGKTHQWVAEKLNCRNQTISKVCRKHSIRVHRTGPRAGEGHPEWKGGKIRYGNKLQYVALYCPGHPHTRRPQKKYVPVHRLVMEARMNGMSLRAFVKQCRDGKIEGLKFLLKNQVVHHKKGYKNRYSNLHVYDSNAEHLAETLAGQVPKWTPEGKARIRQAVRESWKNPAIREARRKRSTRKGSTNDARPNIQTSSRLTV